MANISKEQICALLVDMKVEFSTDESYEDLKAKLKAAQAKEAEPKTQGAPEKKPKPAPAKLEYVNLNRGNDEYGEAINAIIARLNAL